MLLTLMMTADGFFCVGHCGGRLGCPVSVDAHKAVKVPPLCPFLWEETEIQRLELAHGLIPTLPINCHSVCNEPLGDSVASGNSPASLPAHLLAGTAFWISSGLQQA